MWVIFALLTPLCEDPDGVSCPAAVPITPDRAAGYWRPDGPARPALRYRDCCSDQTEHRRLGALRLSISSTVLIFVIIPAAVVTVVASLVFAGSDRSRRSRRYRPGRPYDFQPMWFLAAPERVSATAGAARSTRPAIEAPVLEDSTGARVLPGPTGGASDSW